MCAEGGGREGSRVPEGASCLLESPGSPWAVWWVTWFDPATRGHHVEFLVARGEEAVERHPGTLDGARAAFQSYWQQVFQQPERRPEPPPEAEAPETEVPLDPAEVARAVWDAIEAERTRRRAKLQAAEERDASRKRFWEVVKDLARREQEAARETLPCLRLGRPADPFADPVGAVYPLLAEAVDGDLVRSQAEADRNLDSALRDLSLAVAQARAEFQQVKRCLGCAWFWRCAFFSGRLSVPPPAGESA